MKNFWNKTKYVFYTTGVILTAIILIIVYVMISRWLKAKNKTVTLHPKITIKDIETNDNVDKDELEGAVRIGKEALEKIRKMREN